METGRTADEQATRMKTKGRHSARKAVAAMAVAAALAGGCVAVCFAFWPRERTVQGQIEVLQYAVRTQQSGGVIEVRVKEGDYVEVGDTLLLFKTDDTPMPEDETLELLAATLHPHRTGNRAFDRAYGRWQQAKAAEEQAQKAYREVQRQFLRGRVPAQLRDRAFADYKTFQAQAIATKLVYDEMRCHQHSGRGGLKGPQIVAVITKVEGEVSEIMAKKGEQLAPCAPLMTIALLDNLWGTFRLNEKQRSYFAEGDTLQVYCRAFGLRIPMRVSTIRPYFGAAAATNAGRGRQKEPRHWKMQLRPVAKFEGLRAGMQLEVPME